MADTRVRAVIVWVTLLLARLAEELFGLADKINQHTEARQRR